MLKGANTVTKQKTIRPTKLGGFIRLSISTNYYKYQGKIESISQFNQMGSYLNRVMKNPLIFAHAKSKAQISCTITAQVISTFIFATQIVQSLFFLLKSGIASLYLSSVAHSIAWFLSDLVRNLEEKFSHNVASLCSPLKGIVAQVSNFKMHPDNNTDL